MSEDIRRLVSHVDCGYWLFEIKWIIKPYLMKSTAKELMKIIENSYSGTRGKGFCPVNRGAEYIGEPTETSKPRIKIRYLGHVTGYQPIRDQYFLIFELWRNIYFYIWRHSHLVRSPHVCGDHTRCLSGFVPKDLTPSNSDPSFRQPVVFPTRSYATNPPRTTTFVFEQKTFWGIAPQNVCSKSFFGANHELGFEKFISAISLVPDKTKTSYRVPWKDNCSTFQTFINYNVKLFIEFQHLFQLGELFNVDNVPWPLLTSYTCWGCDHECPSNPVAIHQWRPGCDDRKLRKKLTRPFEKHNLFVSNEAWSEFQGWVEGSLEAAELTIDQMRLSPIGTHQPDDIDKTYEVVVVGAGVTGLYILRELLKDNPKLTRKDILMIESDDRIGGRIWTDKIVSNRRNNMDSFVLCEEGAMRICVEYDEHDKQKFAKDQVMPRLVNLIEDLRKEEGKPDVLPIEPFPMKSTGKLDFNRNNFKGESFTSWYAKENPGIWTRLFGIKQQDEIGKSPSDVYQEVYITLLNANIHKLLTVLGDEHKVNEVLAQKNMALVRIYQNLDFWYEFRRNFLWQNIPIYKYSMRGLLRSMGYSSWIIKMLEEAQFECFIKGDANAGIVIQMERTHAAMESNFSKFSNGFSDLILALKKSLDGRLVVNSPFDDSTWLKLNCRLQTIRKVDLDWSNRGCELVYQPGKNGKKLVRIHAKMTVLAIPRKAIEKVGIMDVPFPELEKLKARYNSVTDVNMTKINLYFNRAWWNDYGEGAREILPALRSNRIRLQSLERSSTATISHPSLYLWYTLGTVHPILGHPSLQLQHSQFTVTRVIVHFGRNSSLSLFYSLLNFRIGSGQCSDSITQYKNQFKPASTSVVKEALFQLGELFNVDNVPWPLLTSYTCWGCDHECPSNPVAIHQWRPGCDDRKLRKKLTRPFEKHNLFVSNEAWSEFQGWVEGSLEAADLTLDQMRLSPIVKSTAKELMKIIENSYSGTRGKGFCPVNRGAEYIGEPTETSKPRIKIRYLGHVTGYQPIRDQYFLIFELWRNIYFYIWRHSHLVRSPHVCGDHTRCLSGFVPKDLTPSNSDPSFRQPVVFPTRSYATNPPRTTTFVFEQKTFWGIAPQNVCSKSFFGANHELGFEKFISAISLVPDKTKTSYRVPWKDNCSTFQTFINYNVKLFIEFQQMSM
eukprot:sb/3461280/